MWYSNLIRSISALIFFLTLSTVSQAACTTPVGTYTGSGIVSDLYQNQSNNEYTAMTLSMTVKADLTFTVQAYLKDLKQQNPANGQLGSGKLTFNKVTCIGTMTFNISGRNNNTITNILSF